MGEPDAFAYAIVENGAPLGIVTRLKVIEALAGPNGHAMFAAAPIAHLMADTFETAEATTPVAAIAKRSADAASRGLSDGVIVLRDGRYSGVAAPTDILSAVAKENAARAKAMAVSNKRLEDAKQSAVEMARDKSRFLAVLSHEIRTPLTGILGLADILADTQLPSDPKRMVKTIGASGRLLDRLLGDMLDLSRMEAGKLSLNPEAFTLRDFAVEAKDLWASKVADKRVQLKIKLDSESEDRIVADAMRLRQILFNLMSNALKFTEKGYVTVTLETPLSAAGKLGLRMVVSDTGCGIADEHKARLFRDFEQADVSTAATHGGSGLGLSIAKGLAQMMGGQITLEDNIGGGSVFTVEVPVDKAGPRLAVANAGKPRRAGFQLGDILVVEDHPVNQLVIERSLSAAGWRVDCVQTAEQAIRRARHKPYQVILMDMFLPDGRGEDVLTALRDDEGGPNTNTPVLAVTADVSPERKARCERLGFDGFVAKPIRPRDLVAVMADTVMKEASNVAIRRAKAI